MINILNQQGEPQVASDTVESKATPPSGQVDVAEIIDAHPPKVRKPRSDKGIPRGPRSGPKPDPNLGQTESVDRNVAAVISPEQILAAVKSLVSVVDSRMQKLVKRMAASVTNDKGFIDGCVEEMAMTTEERDTLASLSVIVLNKYNVLGTYAPECLLGIAIVGYGYRSYKLIQDIKELRAEQNELSSPTESNHNNGTVRDRKD